MLTYGPICSSVDIIHAHHQYYTMHVKGYHFAMKATDMIMKVNNCFVLVKETARNYRSLLVSRCSLKRKAKERQSELEHYFREYTSSLGGKGMYNLIYIMSQINNSPNAATCNA